MRNINQIIDEIEKLETKLMKEISHYKRTGEEERYLKQENALTEFFKDEKINAELIYIEKNIKDETDKMLFDELIRKKESYIKDLEVKKKLKINSMKLRKKRKNINKAEYEKELKKLIKQRNEYARSVGFNNYLELKYEEHKLDRSILEEKIKENIENLKESFDRVKHLDFKHGIPKEKFEVKEQLKLAKATIEDIGLKVDESKINFYLKPDNRKVARACIVPISIPNEVDVIINSVESFGCIKSCMMHELGHALNLNYMDENLNYLFKAPYNSAFNEMIPLFFEKLIFTDEWFEKYLNIKYESENLFMVQPKIIDICSVKFEEKIYSNEDLNYDDVWNEIKKSVAENLNFDWSQIHFFVSEPGYIASYLMAEFISDNLKTYFEESFGSLHTKRTGQFLNNEIFKKGKLINVDELVGKIKLKNTK